MPPMVGISSGCTGDGFQTGRHVGNPGLGLGLRRDIVRRSNEGLAGGMGVLWHDAGWGCPTRVEDGGFEG